MSSVRQKPSGRWEARYRDPSGLQVAKTFPTKTAARRFLERVGADKQRGDYLDPTLGRTRFDDWAGEWLASTAHVKPKTYQDYASMLKNHVLPAFTGRQVGTIDQALVRRFIAELTNAGAGAGTVRAARKILRLVLATAVSDGALRSNPCDGARLPRSAKTEMHFLTADEVATLADAIANPPLRPGGGEHRRATYPELSRLVTFAAYSGLRAGELGALRIRRLHLLEGTVEVAESVSEVTGQGLVYGPTKTYETRRVPIPRFVCELLAEQVGGRSLDRDALVFGAPEGGPLRHSLFYKRHYKPAIVRAGLPEAVRFHDLRHTYAAMLIAEGAHPRAMMERLGHSSVTVTLNTYGHLLPGIDSSLTEALDRAGRAAKSSLEKVSNVTAMRRTGARR
ncbi:MAG TPA: site-specific integrase [Acidimicrobiales bacterium]|nr:site-specific integrase [Acidimicrobiales bacterium]